MRRILIPLIVLLLIAGRAHAQSAPWQPERLTAGWVFTPSFVFGGLWDSNVTVQNRGDITLSEWVALVNPRGEIDYNGRRTHFNLGYSGALEAYRQFEELNRYEQRGRLELRQQLSPRVSAFSRGTFTAAPTTDRLDIGVGLPFVDVGSEIFDIDGGVKFQASRRTHIETSYGFQNVRFDRTEQSSFAFLRGGNSHSVTSTAMHDMTPRFSFGGTWKYQHANVQEREQTFDIHDATADISYRLSETTSVGGGVGISHLSSSTIVPPTPVSAQSTPLDLSATGPAFKAHLEQKAGQAAFSVSFERAFVPSFTFGGVTTNQNFSLNGRMPFYRGRMYLTGGLGWGRTDPVEELGLGFRLDSFYTNLALGYQVASWLRAEGFYNGAHQTSTARGDIDRSRIGFQFITFKPLRIQ